MRLASALLATAILAATPAHAEVTAQTANGFAVSHTVAVSVDPDEAFAMLRTPAKWWAKDHTWTGNAENLYMDAQAGGCFCELIPNEATTESGAPQRTLRGSVQHMQIVYVDPGRLLRLSGALGPMQGEAMAGTLTITLAAVKGGTKLTFDYVVGGFSRIPIAQLAPAVDSVMGEQASRLAMALGPLVGGDKAAPLDKAPPAANDAAGGDVPTGSPAGQGSVSDLVTDLEPDAGMDADVGVSGGAEEMPESATLESATRAAAQSAMDAADAAAKDAEAAARNAGQAAPLAPKTRTKPGTRPISTRATSTSPRAKDDPESGR